MGNYVSIKKGENTWCVYDYQRKATILKSVSPNTSYNEEVCKKTVDVLNKNYEANNIEVPDNN